MRDLRPGDVVHCQGIVCTIKEIVWQEPWEWREAYYLEFLDTNGVYRSWKQNYDGGYAAYLWLDNTGHGLNGAPYDMKDVYEDMEACKKMVYELWKLLSEEDWEEYYED